MAVKIELKGIRNFILQDVNLEVHEGETLALLGPTGAGKTTLLNVLAGLVSYEGTVLMNGSALEGVRVGKRNVGYVFQDPMLFPHLTVRSNVAYGLSSWRRPRREVEKKVNELIGLAGLEHVADRYPKTLSGGEKRRVALMRALAPEPEVLLLDEPLSSLDPAIAKRLRMEIRRIRTNLGITAVYVTHDLKEAEEMADRIAVIHEGRLEQVGVWEEVLFSPANEKVSDFVGGPNILRCDEFKLLGHGLAEAVCGGMSVVVPHESKGIERIAVYPQDVQVYSNRPPGPDVNRFTGLVVGIERLGSTTRLTLEKGGNTLVSELPGEVSDGMDLKVGREIVVQ